jgi:hypothetical protein
MGDTQRGKGDWPMEKTGGALPVFMSAGDAFYGSFTYWRN